MSKHMLPAGLTGKALFDYLVKSEHLIFHAKKSEIKKADAITAMPLFVDSKGQLTSKADMQETQIDPTKLKVVPVINTTNWYDSHGDVHIPGIWKKSLADNKKNGFYLLDSHQRMFQNIIADGCAGQTKNLTWKTLGLDIDGSTEALIFTAIVDQKRNDFMFGQYQQGYVKQHSVGMRYMKMVTCIDDDDYPVQKENWDKYIEMVANRADAEAAQYFWAILEARVIEGSAVVFGSNSITPTLETSLLGTKNEPLPSTQDEPPANLLKWINETTFIH